MQELILSLLAAHTGGQEREALFPDLPPENYKLCILHALMSFGRYALDLVHDVTALIAEQEHNNEIWEDVQQFLTLAKIKITIDIKPLRGWNCKGCYAARLFRYWKGLSLIWRVFFENIEIIILEYFLG